MKVKELFSSVFGTAYPSLLLFDTVLDVDSGNTYVLYKAFHFNELGVMVHLYVLLIGDVYYMHFYNLSEYVVFMSKFKHLQGF